MDASIIVAIITVIGSFALVYLSTIKEVFDRKYDVRKEQLENFYIPFYKKYCAGFFSSNKLSEMDLEIGGQFLDLFTNNIQFMEPKSQSMHQDFYLAFLDMLDATDNHPDFPLDECKQKFDKVFTDMSTAILREYKQILRKCHLPVPLI